MLVLLDFFYYSPTIANVVSLLQFSVFIANEFLDALPVHQFKKDETGNWHEIYVAMNDNEDLCFMLSRMETLFTVLVVYLYLHLL